MTHTGRRIPALLLVLAFLLAVPTMALAQEETTTTVAGTETTEGEAPATTTDLRPAVSLVDEEVAAADPQWTYRYLVPTALVLAVVIILVISVRYFSDVVRKRYRVVEE